MSPARENRSQTALLRRLRSGSEGRPSAEGSRTLCGYHKKRTPTEWLEVNKRQGFTRPLFYPVASRNAWLLRDSVSLTQLNGAKGSFIAPLSFGSRRGHEQEGSQVCREVAALGPSTPLSDWPQTDRRERRAVPSLRATLEAHFDRGDRVGRLHESADDHLLSLHSRPDRQLAVLGRGHFLFIKQELQQELLLPAVERVLKASETG